MDSLPHFLTHGAQLRARKLSYDVLLSSADQKA